MSYYGWRRYARRRGRYSRSTSRRSYESSSPYGKSLQFVRAEFFRFDMFTFGAFSDFYARKYGQGPKQYLQRTYQSWKSGKTNMSGQTEHRILACVPPFLDRGKQFELLSYQIPAVLHQQRAELKVRAIHTSELESTYGDIARSVIEREYKLDWFVNEVFTPDELGEFLNVFKYTMLDCLRQSFSQVQEDLVMLHDVLAKLDGSVDVSYHIALLDCRLDVDVYRPLGVAQLVISMPEPRLVTDFRDQYKTILVDHALTQYKADHIGHTNRQIALVDAEAVFGQLQRTASDQEYDSTLEVQGQGGTLTVRLQKKNLLRLRYTIAIQTVKMIMTICIGPSLVIWSWMKELWPLPFFLGIISLWVISSIWGKLIDLKQEVAEYERGRRSRPTASED